jgi:indole-3-glycerol phosphate synthase
MKAEVNFMAAVIESKRARVLRAKRDFPLDSMRGLATEARSVAAGRVFREALRNDQGVNIIAEIKRASPSKGDLGMKATVAEVAIAYARGGAVAVSALTEQDYFRGALDDLVAIRNSVSLPVLRKDFIFDEYQIYESAAAGADALLLIAAVLNDEELERLLKLAESELGMDALVEVHTRDEMAGGSSHP